MFCVYFFVWCWLLLGRPASTTETCTTDPSVEEASPSCCQSNLEGVDISLSVMLEEDTIDDGMGYIVAPDTIDDGMGYIVAPDASTENITFMCTASRGTVLWQFGGCDVNNVRYQMVDRDEFLNDGIVIQDVQIGVSMLNLKNLGLKFLTEMLKSNVFTVQCLAVVDDLNVYAGDTYTVELYGPPDSPTKLSLSRSDTGASISILEWSGSDCLSPLVPVNYTVTVTVNGSNDTMENTYTIPSVHYSLWDPSYAAMNTFVEVTAPDGVADCTWLLFSVVAMNDVGNSTATEVVDTIPPAADGSEARNSLCVTVGVADGSEVTISLSFIHSTLPGSCYPPTNYTASALDGSVISSVSTSTCSDSCPLQINISSTDFQPNSSYIISFMSCREEIDVCRKLRPVQITIPDNATDTDIPDIVDASVVAAGSTLSLNCSLRPSSAAVGCLFVLTSSSNTSVLETFSVLRSDAGQRCVESNFTNWQSAVAVYGLYEGGQVDSSDPFIANIRVEVNLSTCDIPTISPPTTPDAMNIESVSLEYSEDMGILFKCSLKQPQNAIGCVLTLYRGSDKNKNFTSFSVSGSELDFTSCLQKYKRGTLLEVYSILLDGSLQKEAVNISITEGDLSDKCPAADTKVESASSKVSDGGVAGISVGVFLLGVAGGVLLGGICTLMLSKHFQTQKSYSPKRPKFDITQNDAYIDTGLRHESQDEARDDADCKDESL